MWINFRGFFRYLKNPRKCFSAKFFRSCIFVQFHILKIQAKYGQICIRENKSTRKLILQKWIPLKINLLKVWDFQPKTKKSGNGISKLHKWKWKRVFIRENYFIFKIIMKKTLSHVSYVATKKFFSFQTFTKFNQRFCFNHSG